MTRCHRVRPFHFCIAAAGLLVGLAIAPSPLQAQTPTPSFDSAVPEGVDDWSDDVPAHLAVVDGEGWLQRDAVNEAAAENTPLLAGDRLQTGRGRIEVLFADGSALALDEHTEVAFLSDALLRLDRGRVRLELTRTAGAAGYRVDAAGTTTWIQTAGEYRIQLDERGGAAPDVQLLVIRGSAEIASNHGRTLVRAGYEASASALTAPSLPYAVTVSSWDGFDRWWQARRDERTGFSSTQYLPAEISYYGGVLDRHGDWGYEPTVGYVWYPRVDVAWQPYAVGRWSFVGAYGWVWVGGDRWAWPTHHYGRWGHSGRRYYWIPGRRWAPAWVSWTSAPGYVGWCPLGFDNRPIVSVSIGVSSGWRGWSYVPATSFHTRVVVAHRGRYAPPRNARFVEDYRAPVRPAGLVARNTAGLRGPGASRTSVAVPRWGAPRAESFAPRTGETSERFRGAARASAVEERREVPSRRVATPERTQPAGRIRLSNVPTTESVPSQRGDQAREPASRPSSSPTSGARPRWSAPTAATESIETPRPAPRSSGISERALPATRGRTQWPPVTESVESPAPAGRQLRTMPASPTREWSAPSPRARERVIGTPAPVERTEPAPTRPSSRATTGFRSSETRARGAEPAPSVRAPRTEPSRRAPERQAPAAREGSGGSGSNGGRATPRSR